LLLEDLRLRPNDLVGALVEAVELEVDRRLDLGELLDETVVGGDSLAVGVEHHVANAAPLGRPQHLDDVGMDARLAAGELDDLVGELVWDGPRLVEARVPRVGLGIAVDQALELAVLRAALAHVDLAVAQQDMGVDDPAALRADAPGQLEEDVVRVALDPARGRHWFGCCHATSPCRRIVRPDRPGDYGRCPPSVGRLQARRSGAAGPDRPAPGGAAPPPAMVIASTGPPRQPATRR